MAIVIDLQDGFVYVHSTTAWSQLVSVKKELAPRAWLSYINPKCVSLSLFASRSIILSMYR